MFFTHGIIFSIALAFKTVRGQGSVIVEDDDPILSYTNAFQWQFNSNPQALPGGTVDNNYWHGGSGRAIASPDASVSLIFNGSRIAFYGDLNSDHGTIEVDLDGRKTIVDAFRGAGPASQVKLFEGNVDIKLTCIQRRGMSIDYFEYTHAVPTTTTDSTTTPGPGPTSPTAPASTLSSPPSNNSNTPVIVAAVLAGLGWCIVIGLAVFLLHFRRQSQKEAFTVPSGRARMVHACEDSNFRRSSGSVVTETRAETRPGPSSERLSGYTSLPPDFISAYVPPTAVSSVPAKYSDRKGKITVLQADPPAYA